VYDFSVIRRLYVHNFRCLENFELPISRQSSALLIGKNGSGKTTIGVALEIMQRIARGTNRVGDLLKPKDFARERSDVPIRFEIEVELSGRVYMYVLALDFPPGFKELRVLQERLSVDGQAIYDREIAQVHLARIQQDKEATFAIDWHLVALPIVQLRPTNPPQNNPLFVFKEWLGRVLILRPVPTLISGDSTAESLQPDPHVTDFGAWFSGLLAEAPSAYTRIADYLKQVMPDFKDIKNPAIGKDARSLTVQFASDNATVTLPFGDLSDGEKCFMICALVLASHDHYDQLVCFWDEPDNYLALDEIGHFITTLRQVFRTGGQFIATSHNPEAIRRFSDENTIVLQRRSHLEPTVARPLSQLQIHGDLVDALIRGDVQS
jgi:ABC-type cobalamin/Fe3+-siderophores transport system ATPase subunit